MEILPMAFFFLATVKQANIGTRTSVFLEFKLKFFLVNAHDHEIFVKCYLQYVQFCIFR